MADPASIPPPNYTQIPNAIFELMADKGANLKEVELRVILAIARKTFGWHKKRDKISLTQLEKATALSRPSVVTGLEAAIARGIVRRTPDRDDKRGGFFYELVVDEPNDQTSKNPLLVKEVNQSNSLTRTSKNPLPELVKDFNTQKKEKEKKERGGESPALTPPVQAYFETYPNETLDADQVAFINEAVASLPVWKRALKYWKANRHRPQSVGKILERYQEELAGKHSDATNGHQSREPNRPIIPDVVAGPDTRNTPSETARKAREAWEQRKQ